MHRNCGRPIAGANVYENTRKAQLARNPDRLDNKPSHHIRALKAGQVYFLIPPYEFIAIPGERGLFGNRQFDLNFSEFRLDQFEMRRRSHVFAACLKKSAQRRSMLFGMRTATTSA